MLIQSLSKKPSEQNNNLVQKCTMIEGLLLVSVITIHDAYFIIWAVANTNENIVLYTSLRQTWVDEI